MCIYNLKLYKRPIKKAYKVLEKRRNSLHAPIMSYFEYDTESVICLIDVPAEYGIHFFASKAAAIHYRALLAKTYPLDIYRVFEAYIPTDAIVCKGDSNGSYGFDTKRYPATYTTNKIKIIRECK